MASDKLQAMRVFRRVIELGSFTAAAEDLNFTPATISKHIAFLEEQLSTRLIQRTTRRMHLSDSGEQYYERVCHLLDDLEETEYQVKGLDIKPKGRLRISVPMSFGLPHINPAIESFLKAYPDINIDVHFSDHIVDLVEQGIDVAIRIHNKLEDSSLSARTLCQISRVICASPSYLDQAGVPELPNDLKDHNCLVFSLLQSADVWHLGDQAVSVKGNYRSNNSLAIKQLLLNGMGISQIPTFLVHKELQRGQLQVVLPDYQPPGRTIYALFPPGRYRPKKVRCFLDHLSEWFGTNPYWEIIS